MPTILIFASDAVIGELATSPVGREGFERVTARSATEALSKALALQPRLVVVDSGHSQADALVRQLRAGAGTRSCSILVVASETWEAELGLLEAGANAVLRLPPGHEWDARIQSLLQVPTRKGGRIDGTIHLRGIAGEHTLRARVNNISPTGMLMETTVVLAVGSSLRFDLELPGFEASSGEVAGSGRVVRQAGTGSYGIEFSALDPNGRELLRRYLLPR